MQIVDAKQNDRSSALKEVNSLCKERFTAGMFRGSLAEGRDQNEIYPTYWHGKTATTTLQN